MRSQEASQDIQYASESKLGKATSRKSTRVFNPRAVYFQLKKKEGKTLAKNKRDEEEQEENPQH